MAVLKSISTLAGALRISLPRIPVTPIRPFPIPIPLPLPPPITPLGENGVIPASARTRPFWFNGRFLAAQDLERDQNYFLQDQAVLGAAAGFGVVHGLEVTRAISGGEPDAEKFTIAAGQGITPGGDLVMLSSALTIQVSDIADEEDLDVQFGLAETPDPLLRTRTGLYVIALRPVEFTANPITSYPTSIQGSRATHDGSVIEATAVSLIPYPIPASNYDSTSQNAAAARQVFLENNPGMISDSLLPVAMISLERGAIQWIDQWMVRRESGPEFNDLRFGLANIATQQAYLRQFDAQLQLLLAESPASFAAAASFQSLPPAGRFPFAAVNASAMTQIFFPAQAAVTLSLVPEDELAALIADSLSLAPIDLTLPANAYADLSVLMLVPVSRADYDKFSRALPPAALSSPAPAAFSIQSPLQLLRFFEPPAPLRPAADVSITWQSAIGSLAFGYYIRRRSVPAFVSFTLTNTTTLLSVAAVTGSQATQYSASVTPAAATGTVVFNDGANPLGTADVQSGIATLALPNLAPGNHALTAVYQGDVNYAASTSPVVSITIGGT